jgi:hypothetical protein
MLLPVSVVAFDPSCQQTLSSSFIGSDWIGAAVGPQKVRVHWTRGLPVVIRSFTDSRKLAGKPPWDVEVGALW